jgi:uncharacterized protein YcfJ
MKKIAIAAMMALTTAPLMMPPAADAQSRHRTYRGYDRDYRYRCKRSKGTTGLIAGGAGGALLGNALGGGTLGTVAGGVGGALLGKHLDKKHDAAQNRRNGC